MLNATQIKKIWNYRDRSGMNSMKLASNFQTVQDEVALKLANLLDSNSLDKNRK